MGFSEVPSVPQILFLLVFIEFHWFKVYDKGLQYGLDGNLIRIEIKQKNWSRVRASHGIVTLEDWNNADKRTFIRELYNRWDQVVFCDRTNGIEHMTKEQLDLDSWLRLRREKSNQTYMRKRRDLKEVNAVYGNDVQNEILRAIEDTAKGLLR